MSYQTNINKKDIWLQVLMSYQTNMNKKDIWYKKKDEVSFGSFYKETENSVRNNNFLDKLTISASHTI